MFHEFCPSYGLVENKQLMYRDTCTDLTSKAAQNIAKIWGVT